MQIPKLHVQTRLALTVEYHLSDEKSLLWLARGDILLQWLGEALLLEGSHGLTECTYTGEDELLEVKIDQKDVEQDKRLGHSHRLFQSLQAFRSI